MRGASCDAWHDSERARAWSLSHCVFVIRAIVGTASKWNFFHWIEIDAGWLILILMVLRLVRMLKVHISCQWSKHLSTYRIEDRFSLELLYSFTTKADLHKQQSWRRIIFEPDFGLILRRLRSRILDLGPQKSWLNRIGWLIALDGSSFVSAAAANRICQFDEKSQSWGGIVVSLGEVWVEVASLLLVT